MTVLDRRLTDTPVAVLDFETTGLSPKVGARVIEVGVVRIDPSADPAVALDTLIDPEGPVYATRIHGITDDDVVGAPLFSDLAGQLGGVLESAVVAAFNASFDMSFLAGELDRFPRGKAAWIPPHLCLMYLRPALGVGGRCSLSEACIAHGVPAPSHRAIDDALAAANLWVVYRDAALSAGARTFADLGAGRYKFAQSLGNRPFDEALATQLGPRPCPTALKPRADSRSAADAVQPPEPASQRRRRYWHALVDALSDGFITDQEIATLQGEQQRLQLPPEDTRALHARLFGEMLRVVTEDEAVSVGEVSSLAELSLALRSLGWAPGESMAGRSEVHQ